MGSRLDPNNNKMKKKIRKNSIFRGVNFSNCIEIATVSLKHLIFGVLLIDYIYIMGLVNYYGVKPYTTVNLPFSSKVNLQWNDRSVAYRAVASRSVPHRYVNWGQNILNLTLFDKLTSRLISIVSIYLFLDKMFRLLIWWLFLLLIN